MPKTILIADSEHWSLEIVTKLARDRGYETIIAANGIEAIERFMNHSPDMIFIDNLLEKLDGFNAAKRIRGTEPGRVVPIVLLSAIYKEGEEVRRLVEKYGFNEFVAKPFSESAITSLFDAFLGDEAEVKVQDRLLELNRPDTPLDIEGEIEVTPLSEVLFDLYRKSKTGLLYTSSGEFSKVLYLEHGNITFARSNSSRHRLGRLLVKARSITAEQYERALQIQTLDKGRTRLGMILVSMGALSEEKLKSAVHSQILAIIFSLFETRTGRYWFVDGIKTKDEHFPLDLNTLDILMWGIRKTDDAMDFKAHLPEPGMIVTKAAGHEQLMREVTLTYFDRQILGFIDGTKSVGEIVSIGLLAQIPVYRILYALFKIGVIEAVSPDGGGTQPRAAGPLKNVRQAVIPTRGRLLSIGTVRLLSNLYFSAKSGVLQVQKDGQSKSLFIKEGRILFARSNMRNDRIGYLLLTSGKVTRDEYDRAIETRRLSPSIRIGTLFVEMGAISLDDLHWIVKFQIMRILRSIFEYEDAEFAFSEGVLPTEEMITLDHSTPDLIMDCVRSMPITAQVRVHQPLMSSQVLKAMDDNQIRRLITVTPSEDKVLSYLGPGRTMAELREIDFMTSEDLERVIYGFSGLNIIKAITGAERAQSLEEVVNLGMQGFGIDEEGIAAAADKGMEDRDADDSALVREKMARMEMEIERLREINKTLSSRLEEPADKRPNPTVEPQNPVPQ